MIMNTELLITIEEGKYKFDTEFVGEITVDTLEDTDDVYSALAEGLQTYNMTDVELNDFQNVRDDNIVNMLDDMVELGVISDYTIHVLVELEG